MDEKRLGEIEEYIGRHQGQSKYHRLIRELIAEVRHSQKRILAMRDFLVHWPKCKIYIGDDCTCGLSKILEGTE